jgi:hypothetical protein
MTVFFNGTTTPKECNSITLNDTPEGVEITLKDREGSIIGGFDLAIVKSIKDQSGNFYLLEFPSSKLRMSSSL